MTSDAGNSNALRGPALAISSQVVKCTADSSNKSITILVAILDKLLQHGQRKAASLLPPAECGIIVLHISAAC